MGREVKEQGRKMRKEETVTTDLLHRAVPAKQTDEGLCVLSVESPIHPVLAPTSVISKVYAGPTQDKKGNH
jgi:hypothetical protein